MKEVKRMAKLSMNKKFYKREYKKAASKAATKTSDFTRRHETRKSAKKESFHLSKNMQKSLYTHKDKPKTKQKEYHVSHPDNKKEAPVFDLHFFYLLTLVIGISGIVISFIVKTRLTCFLFILTTIVSFINYRKTK
ncbi:hypothetical protein IV49_GL000937 [Kandleria vitulina DSM 20405]|jgi:uncharacterized membrane protein|uniref:Uncharacterized protein n=2 Tax=Kandleria vitulina TaxID=1630 RepID=A0A0R2HI76_9FIRM|nr:hypothetical protein IV49_GL000937 [Kandleria vitulina DSM 20405]